MPSSARMRAVIWRKCWRGIVTPSPRRMRTSRPPRGSGARGIGGLRGGLDRLVVDAGEQHPEGAFDRVEVAQGQVALVELSLLHALHHDLVHQLRQRL